MIELPEAVVLSQQIGKTLTGKKIIKVVTAMSPHKFAWYYKDPQKYEEILLNKKITGSTSYGGHLEIRVQNVVLLFTDGVNLRYYKEQDQRPNKHQLFIEFDDGTAMSANIQMYGGLWCFPEGEFQNSYYLTAKEKPSPLTKEFDRLYFDSAMSFPGAEKLSIKALLATEQRIPGLGNGILQDILYNARIHPKRKTSTLKNGEWDQLFDAIKGTIFQMTCMGGRDTEKDFFGLNGGYTTKLSKNTVDSPCSVCGAIIKKDAYMGGSIYYCSGCQPL